MRQSVEEGTLDVEQGILRRPISMCLVLILPLLKKIHFGQKVFECAMGSSNSFLTAIANYFNNLLGTHLGPFSQSIQERKPGLPAACYLLCLKLSRAPTPTRSYSSSILESIRKASWGFAVSTIFWRVPQGHAPMHPANPTKGRPTRLSHGSDKHTHTHTHRSIPHGGLQEHQTTVKVTLTVA